MLDAAGGPRPARDAEGRLFDILDVSDQLAERYRRIFVVDLDGLENDQPQLDYLQEIARTAEVWMDCGVRTSDQAIDVVVAGAFRTVLSTAHLKSERELEQAWKLSPEVAFEVETRRGFIESPSKDFHGHLPVDLAGRVRRSGVRDVIYSPRDGPVDWAIVRALAIGGPVWVGGSFDRNELGALGESGAAGGIFSIAEELGPSPALSGPGA